MAIRDNEIMRGLSNKVASGEMGIAKRIKLYPPSFNIIAASITEPPVGACTWASGSHVWSGHIGILTAKAIKNARK